MSKDRKQASRNGDDKITVISPHLNCLDSSNLSQSASKQKVHSNKSQNEFSQTPRQQKLDLHLNVSERVLQSDDDKNDYYKRQVEFELLAENDEYRQESLRQQTYQSYGNESQFNQHPLSAHFNRAYDYKDLEEDNDQNDPNFHQQCHIQENYQNHFEVQVNNSQLNRDFQEHYQPSASNNFVVSRNDEQFQPNRHQNHFETGAEQFHSIQYYGNSSFVDYSGDKVQRQNLNAHISSVLDANYEVQNQQQKRRSIPTQIYHNSSLQNERSFSQSAHNPNEPIPYCNINAEWLMKRIEELESERNDWKKQSRKFEEKLHEANHRVEKYKTDGNAKLIDVKKQFDSYKIQAKKDYKSARDDVAHYRNKSIDYKKQRDDLKSDLKKQEENHKSAIHKLSDQIEKLKEEANKVTADKSTETDDQLLETDNNLQVGEQGALLMDNQAVMTQIMDVSNSAQAQSISGEVHSPTSQKQSLVVEANSKILPTVSQTLPLKEVKPEIIDSEAFDAETVQPENDEGLAPKNDHRLSTADGITSAMSLSINDELNSNLPANNNVAVASILPSTSNDSAPWLALGLSQEEYDAGIQAEYLQEIEKQWGMTGDELNESMQANKEWESQGRLGDRKKSRRNAPRKARATPSTQSGSKRKNSASTAQDQQRSQKDYHAISKRPKL